MDLNQYILALKARRKAFLTVLAVTVFTAIVVALVIPKRYDATATILIDARDEQTLAPAHMSPRERAGDRARRLGRRESGELDAADQRHLDRAALVDARVGGEIGLLVHGDVHRVARPELVRGLRQARQGQRGE